ncbi:hypothetical protein [Methylobacterium nodulans]|uniref:Uncharacterized protein n=1 Tax=Methylobacterium nodulans (strain LMG 21967 / CNCM I-2342 / ORS 2060) TaxID=460265 RepID=B8IQG7_METNO|nr:hypothetical protein [Methylobacterium nodulans]ACL60479.1 conserved hypothetical protein [Methylobacterium nodulans ORS 2060]
MERWVNNDDLAPCVPEGHTCVMPYPTNIFYGVPGKLVGRPFPKGGQIACNNQNFGDPAPGQKKVCYYARRAKR